MSVLLLCVCHLTRSDRCRAVFFVLDALFGHFLPRNSVVPMIFCAVTCKADTIIALAFYVY